MSKILDSKIQLNLNKAFYKSVDTGKPIICTKAVTESIGLAIHEVRLRVFTEKIHSDNAIHVKKGEFFGMSIDGSYFERHNYHWKGFKTPAWYELEKVIKPYKEVWILIT